MGALKTFSDRLLGRGSAALTVPPMDGALSPTTGSKKRIPALPRKSRWRWLSKTARWCGRKASNYGQRLAL